MTFLSPLSGSGGLVKVGGGTLSLGSTSSTYANTYTGNTTVNAGTLVTANNQNNSAGDLSASSGVIINNGGTLLAYNINPWGYGTHPPVTINAGGLMMMADGGHQDLGLLTLNGGTLASTANPSVYGSWLLASTCNVIADSIISATGVCPINTSAGNFNVSPGVTLNVPGTITNISGGTGWVIKNGGGAMVLGNSNNSYTGGTTLNAGLLNFVSSALGPSGAITLSGGTLQWAAGNTQDISGHGITLSAGQTPVLDIGETMLPWAPILRAAAACSSNSAAEPSR